MFLYTVVGIVQDVFLYISGIRISLKYCDVKPLLLL